MKPLGLERDKGAGVDLGHAEYIYYWIYIFVKSEIAGIEPWLA
jgi:hypothetical protein